ncbi:MAG: hypothetical protein QXI43_04835 [Candidatus Nitrosocaldus sp.]
MLVLLAGERILLQKEGSLTIKYKSRGGEKGKGTLYITNLRLAFEDNKKGILLQVFPAQYELQAYRVSKGLLSKEKLMLDIEKRVEGKSLFVTAEVEVEGKDSKKIMKGVEEALQTLLNSSSIMTTVSSSSSSSSSISSSNRATSNYTMKHMEEERSKDKISNDISKDKVYEELGFDIHEGDEIVKFFHDVRIEGNWYGYEVNDTAKIVITKYDAEAILPYWHFEIIPIGRVKAYIDSKEKNVMHITTYTSNPPKEEHVFKLTFKNEEEAREACEAYIQAFKNRREKKHLGRYVGAVMVKTMTYDPPRIEYY